jgi:hypothetical protein
MLRPDDILYGLNVNEIAARCGVDLATARRWKRGATCPPQTALMLLARDLGCFHPRWKGWQISERGELCSPENWIATPGDVLSIQLVQAQLATYRSENRALKQALAAEDAEKYEEQPAPGDWQIEFETVAK